MPEFATLAEGIGKAADALGVRVAVAESLTGGLVCSTLAKAPDAARWFAGGIVAYGSDVKHHLLDVPPGPVVSIESARAMASSTARLLRAEFVVALTGVGGPDPQDDRPPGTVYLGLHTPAGTTHDFLHIDGGPEAVCRTAALKGLSALYRVLAP